MRKFVTAAVAAAGVLLSFAAASNAYAQDDMKKIMRPFYTDDGMKTPKTGDDFMAAYKSMSAEDLAKMKAFCAGSNSPRDTTCENFNAINGQ